MVCAAKSFKENVDFAQLTSTVFLSQQHIFPRKLALLLLKGQRLDFIYSGRYSAQGHKSEFPFLAETCLGPC